MASDTTFFSYSRTDSAFVVKLAKDLRDAGAELWLDQLDIKAGSHWDSSIESALNVSTRLLIILSPEAVASNNVMDEVSYALESNKTVIPELLSECTPPIRLRRLQRIDFTGDYQHGLNQLLEVLGLVPGYNAKTVEPQVENESIKNTLADETADNKKRQNEEADNTLWENARRKNSIPPTESTWMRLPQVVIAKRSFTL